MTTTKLPTDSDLATPIGGKVVDPELEAKLTDDKQRHKRARFKALIIARLTEVKFRMKQVKNVANRSNYVYTETEAKAIVKFMQEQLDEAADEFLDPLKDFNAQPIQFDTTEYD
tara:strand:+ start:348 stop:689 length:342 start_codon:yes stop_codon:yes gene_type:complete